jgi:hypothetical protein
MLTLFALPKPFRGPIATIQRNALSSWSALPGPPQILVFGDEDGAAAAAAAIGARSIPEVQRNPAGTPIVTDLFRRAELETASPALCYVNSDIVLFDELAEVAGLALAWGRPFLVVGQCRNLDVEDELDLQNASAREALRRRAEERGVLRGAGGIDYFLFSRGLYADLPPFLIGRAGFDNWLVWRARKSRALVVDATRSILAVHQNHDYAHLAEGRASAYTGEEAAANLRLAGVTRLYNIDDASHELRPSGLRRRLHALPRSVPALRRLWLQTVPKLRRWSSSTTR